MLKVKARTETEQEKKARREAEYVNVFRPVVTRLNAAPPPPPSRDDVALQRIWSQIPNESWINSPADAEVLAYADASCRL